MAWIVHPFAEMLQSRTVAGEQGILWLCWILKAFLSVSRFPKHRNKRHHRVMASLYSWVHLRCSLGISRCGSRTARLLLVNRWKWMTDMDLITQLKKIWYNWEVIGKQNWTNVWFTIRQMCNPSTVGLFKLHGKLYSAYLFGCRSYTKI